MLNKSFICKFFDVDVYKTNFLFEKTNDLGIVEKKVLFAFKLESYYR